MCLDRVRPAIGSRTCVPSCLASPATWAGWVTCALLFAYVSPLWADLRSWAGTFDWGYFFFLAEVDRKAIVEFRQLPLWNPYYCGGSVHLANPQSFTLSPFTLFVLAFGTPLGFRFMLTAATLMAADGVRRWSRELGVDGASAWLAGTFFAASGAMAQHLGGGHLGWMGFALTPYTLWAFHRALDGDRRFVAVGALFLSWIFLHFGVYPYPYATLALGAYGLSVGIAQSRVPPAIAIGLAMVALSLGLCGLRLVPLVEFILQYPRVVWDQDALLFRELWEIYAVRHTARAFGVHRWVWPEYGNYVGVLGIAAVGFGGVTAGICRASRRLVWPVVVSAVLFVALQMGNHPGFPWTYVRKLPVFENLRVPSRFTTLVGLFAAPLFGWAASVFVASARRGSWRVRVPSVAGVLLLLVSLGNQIEFNRRQWHQAFGRPPPRDVPSPSFHQVSGNSARMYAYPRVNRGSLSCFEESPVPKSKLLSGTRETEEWLLHSGGGSAVRRGWSPNRITVDVRLTEPNTLLINQNYASGWRSSAGQVISHQGLLGVELPAGTHLVTLSYRPRSFLWGLAVSALALLVSIRLLWRRRRTSEASRSARSYAPGNGEQRRPEGELAQT